MLKRGAGAVVAREIEEGKSKKAKTEESTDESNQEFKPLCDIESVVLLLRSFSDEKRKVIDDLGLSGLRKWQCKHLRKRMCQWMIARFDPDVCKLKIGEEETEITGSHVEWLLGLQNSGLPLERGPLLLDAQEDDFKDFLTEYRHFSTDMMASKLRSMNHDHACFKRLLMMFLLTAVLVPTEDKKPHEGYLHFLSNQKLLSSVNWAKVVLDGIVEEMRQLRSLDEKVLKGGCTFFFMILFAEYSTKSSLDEIWKMPLPRVKDWKSRTIKDLHDCVIDTKQGYDASTLMIDLEDRKDRMRGKLPDDNYTIFNRKLEMVIDDMKLMKRSHATLLSEVLDVGNNIRKLNYCVGKWMETYTVSEGTTNRETKSVEVEGKKGNQENAVVRKLHKTEDDQDKEEDEEENQENDEEGERENDVEGGAEFKEGEGEENQKHDNEAEVEKEGAAESEEGEGENKQKDEIVVEEAVEDEEEAESEEEGEEKGDQEENDETEDATKAEGEEGEGEEGGDATKDGGDEIQEPETAQEPEPVKTVKRKRSAVGTRASVVEKSASAIVGYVFEQDDKEEVLVQTLWGEATRADMQTLKPSVTVAAAVIDLVGISISKKDETVFYIPTTLWEQEKNDDGTVAPSTNLTHLPLDAKICSKIILPLRDDIKRKGHWFLCVVDMSAKEYLIFDPFPGKRKAARAKMATSLVKSVADTLTASSPKYKRFKNIPKFKLDHVELPAADELPLGSAFCESSYCVLKCLEMKGDKKDCQSKTTYQDFPQYLSAKLPQLINWDENKVKAAVVEKAKAAAVEKAKAAAVEEPKAAVVEKPKASVVGKGKAKAVQV